MVLSTLIQIQKKIRMKKNILILFSFAVILFACKKDYSHSVAVYKSDLSNSAFLKVIDATLNSSRTYVYQDALQIPMSGTAMSIAFASGTGSFPANTTYASIPSGNRVIIAKDTLATTKQKVISVAQNLNAGSYYTLFMYDTATNATPLFVKDSIQTTNDLSTARIRFANLVYASTSNVDIYSSHAAGNLFTNISVGQATGFISIPANITDTFYVRATGTTTNLASYPPSPVITGATPLTPVAGRSYTLAFEGKYDVAPTKTALGPTNPTRSLVVYTNR
jgi:hypothetical protein